MGFVSKIKNIFYDDIEDEDESEGISIKIEPSKEENTVKPVIIFDEPETKTVKEEVIGSVKNDNPFSERELFKPDNAFNDKDIFKSEKAFNFTEFDDEEDEAPKISPIELERKTRVERPQTIERSQTVERVERAERKLEDAPRAKAFKPSPVISPIYGILDKDYVKEDITTRKKEDIIIGSESTVRNYENVRKKAYGTKDIMEDTIIDTPLEVKQSIDEIEKDIDELNDTTTKIENLINRIEESTEVTVGDVEELRKDDIFEEDDDKTVSDDTLEHDLFNLIDSMYDRED